MGQYQFVYETLQGTEYEKLEKHRALDDIRESIEELEFYLTKVEA